ncbi:MAG: hypothetical protein M1816_003454 [Peltula sp. TS41687]|nr:MAG: hypothetical protein M1816_003454 [Peltula sp. TS41687]
MAWHHHRDLMQGWWRSEPGEDRPLGNLLEFQSWITRKTTLHYGEGSNAAWLAERMLLWLEEQEQESCDVEGDERRRKDWGGATDDEDQYARGILQLDHNTIVITSPEPEISFHFFFHGFLYLLTPSGVTTTSPERVSTVRRPIVNDDNDDDAKANDEGDYDYLEEEDDDDNDDDHDDDEGSHALDRRGYPARPLEEVTARRRGRAAWSENDWRALCYCRRIGEAEALAKQLRCGCYHDRLDETTRAQNLSRWHAGGPLPSDRVLVSTWALGAGIKNPRVRLVLRSGAAYGTVGYAEPPVEHLVTVPDPRGQGRLDQNLLILRRLLDSIDQCLRQILTAYLVATRRPNVRRGP